MRIVFSVKTLCISKAPSQIYLKSTKNWCIGLVKPAQALVNSKRGCGITTMHLLEWSTRHTEWLYCQFYCVDNITVQRKKNCVLLGLGTRGKQPTFHGEKRQPTLTFWRPPSMTDMFISKSLRCVGHNGRMATSACQSSSSTRTWRWNTEIRVDNDNDLKMWSREIWSWEDQQACLAV